MKYLQKVTRTLEAGKVKSEKKGEIIAVVDSIGDNLVTDGEQAQEAKKDGTLTVYIETTKAAKVAQDKGKKKPNPKAPKKQEEEKK
ncbi:hypothetical protein [Flagellimonas flava]|uniref:hypothetical protein n=1 Tax=Flagellimonas flava TaxID=570519 RepID=UPI003D655641